MLAIVTGGTSGIGFEISKQFILRGDSVIAIYNSNDEKANQAKKEINSNKYTIKKLDVTNEILVKEYFSSLDKIDYLVNCAGISIEAPFEDLAIDSIKKVIDVNLYGKMICSKYALPKLKESTQPRIVNIASRFAEKPFIEGMMGYSCSEAGIVMMTKF